ncbi:hypothetical protein BJY04DRAFT_195786 [Aspergillus karnatakaensis]|uniref:uncharacterized protein n=1 Tax=Aspergillus karnatakaensis TaxID=1810916 RepID=UPI003CCD8E87
MGIPMWREPSSAETGKSDKVKDPCAAARSAIRRQPTVRRASRYGGPSSRGSTLRPQFHRPTQEDVEHWANRANVSLRNANSNSPIPRPAIESLFDLPDDLADSQREAGLRSQTDTSRLNRLRQRIRLRNSTVPYELQVGSSSAGNAGRVEHHDYLPFTPRFAPAIAYHRPSPPLPGPDVFGLPPMPPHDSPGPDGQSASFIPLLRRVGQRSMNVLNSTPLEPLVDGLGDRQRSADLEDDHANDAWETLLTTITPDTNLPSADSSFTSASVSGTNPSHNGTSRSSATSLESLQNSLHAAVPTVQMTLDPYLDSNPCDYPSSTDSDTESDGEITQQSLFRRYRRSMRNFESMRRSHHLQQTMNNPPSVPTISFAFSDSSADQDLHNMHAILDRLARREDIPDDWWAAAGLSRTINQRASAGDDSNVSRGPDGPVRQG